MAEVAAGDAIAATRSTRRPGPTRKFAWPRGMVESILSAAWGTRPQLLGSLYKVRESGSSRCAMWTSDLARSRSVQERNGGTVAAYATCARYSTTKHRRGCHRHPNIGMRWHRLACQQARCLREKPFSYNIWEGRQMVAAARNTPDVQVGTQRRSSTVLRQAVEYLRSGQSAHPLCLRPRLPTAGRHGQVARHAGPASVNYTVVRPPKSPLMRKQLHYDCTGFGPRHGEIATRSAPHRRVPLMLDRTSCPTAISNRGRSVSTTAANPEHSIAFLTSACAPHLRGPQRAVTEGLHRQVPQRWTRSADRVRSAASLRTLQRPSMTAREEDQEILETKKSQNMEVLHLANFVIAVPAEIAELNAESIRDTSPPPALTWRISRTAR